MLPPGVKWLLISNTVLFVLYFFAARTGLGSAFYHFGLVPRAVTHLLAVWQLGTYMFLHDPFGVTHILLNMLMLWMFGTTLENTWGTKRFLQYYSVCGVGAALCVVVLATLFGNAESRTIGASGAIFGLLLAFGVLFPDAQMLFMFIFPLKAKYCVMIYGAIEFLFTLGSTGDGVSHVAHLGGMAFGYFYLRSNVFKFRRWDLTGFFRARYREWKLQRAKKKFQVYLRKHGSGPSRDIH
ncbi:MAG: rhomboid family intramembrane serine protease [Acidobacteria bacterium]|nr:rhomboid family intramembrane serine protease [Acidobacteriota bacterium]